MLRNIKQLCGFTILAQDSKIGNVHGFYFDDKIWTIRYLVGETGWLSSRRVVVSPVSLSQVHWAEEQVVVNLTKAQIEESPEIDVTQAWSYQQIERLSFQAGPPLERLGGGLFDEKVVGAPPDSIVETIKAKEALAAKEKSFSAPAMEDAYLRYTDNVIGYHIQARDGEIGQVEDFLFDEETWIIHYLVVDTRTWLPDKKVLVSPRWVEDIDWAGSKVSIDLTREATEHSPAYNVSKPVTRAYEEQLFDHYGRQKYWIE